MFKMHGGWVLSTDSAKTVKTQIDADGVWLHNTTHGIRSDVKSSVFFSAGTGDPSGASVSVGLTAFDGKMPIPVVGASKTLSGLASGQDAIDVLFYPIGRVAITVQGLPAGTAIAAEVIQ